MFDGIKIKVNEHLPKTVLDKDGNEVPLLGVMCYPPPTLEELANGTASLRLVMLVGEDGKMSPQTEG